MMDRMEIKGKVNTAVCYARVIEPEAIEQIRRMCDYDMTAGSQIRIMPDVHAGTGCTIGTTMTITDKVVPNVVGVDIGCGMYTINLGKIDLDYAAIDRSAHGIPSGRNAWGSPRRTFPLEQLYCYEHLTDLNWIQCSLGTLGGGNHFIEIDEAQDGTKYLIIHTGSRNLGLQVAKYYQQAAIDLQHGVNDYEKRRVEIIHTLKEQGRAQEISAALQALDKEYKTGTCSTPDDLCYLTGDLLARYLHDVEVCQRFARRNRELIAEFLLLENDLIAVESFHTIHNYIDTEEMILRKGAIAAHAGEKVLIPINMKDGCILATGKGNPEWNYSAPHGAGRIMSRRGAKETLSLAEYEETMRGIYSTTVCAETLDEAPMAYKRLADIQDVIAETVDVIDVLHPVYNFKAAE